jgi:cytochrome c-type biogenesis protein
VDAGVWTFLFGYAAGALSTLSPCVVPLLPIVVASALAQHRFGVWALACGLALSFALVGVFFATVGFSIGIDGGVLRRIAGVVLIVFGALMASARLQQGFASATAALARGGEAAIARTHGGGWRGQLAVGALLGIVWTPCVGPTLGAATTLLAQGRRVGEVALLMLVFGLGAATPLVAFGALARRLRSATSARWLFAAEAARRILGASLVVVGAMLVLGIDKPLETWLLDHSPDWLTRLTTRY